MMKILPRTGLNSFYLNPVYAPRCHLGSRIAPCAQRDTNISPATNVCPTSQNTRLAPFPAPSAVHLTGCLSIRLSATRTLCARISRFYLRFNGFLFNFFFTITQPVEICQEKSFRIPSGMIYCIMQGFYLSYLPGVTGWYAKDVRIRERRRLYADSSLPAFGYSRNCQAVL